MYNPLRCIPSRQDLAAGWNFIRMVSQIQGAVFISYHGHYAVMAGKEPHAQGMFFDTFLNGKDEMLKGKMTNEILEALQEKKYAAIISDDPSWGKDIFEKNYTMQSRVFRNADVFRPVAGNKTRPEVIYVRKR